MKPSAETRTALRRLQHELRTPLAQILGYGEILQEDIRERGLDDLLPDLTRIQFAARELLGRVEQVFGAEAGALPPQALPSVEKDRLRGRLLVVDDEPANRELLARRLEKRGFDVRTVADGRTALHAIEAEAFDVVLLDVMMPGISGLQVLEAIRATRGPGELPVIMTTALDGREDVVAALSRGANDYVTKPIDFPVALARIEGQLALRNAAQEIRSLAQQLELRNAFIRRIFGRYVSDEVAAELLEKPDALELGGERRTVTILMSDLRGFTTLAEALLPYQIVSLLNNHLSAMTAIIYRHGGTVVDFIGDAVLALFGAPLRADDDAERAVACAVAMQRAMEEVNETNRRRGLPEIEMGIGIATGEVVVGNVGSERRAKYGAMGSPVNLAARIESYTLGGEILISADTRRSIGDVVRIDADREVHPKGFENPIRIFRVAGVGGRWDVVLERSAAELVDLAPPLAIRLAPLEGKQVGPDRLEGEISALSANAVRIRASLPMAEMTDLRIELAAEPAAGAAYAKVVSGSAAPDAPFAARFTLLPTSFSASLARLLRAGATTA
jgi:class 3 adenylate cyclase